MKIIVSTIVEKKINKGISLLDSSDFKENQNLPDGQVSLFSKSRRYLGEAYLSPQNKGIGWLFSRNKIALSVDFFTNLFKKAKTVRQPFYHSNLTTAFRLFNQDGDGFGGLTIDLYGDYAVFSWYNSFVYSIRQLVIEAFQIVFPEVVGAYEKIRFQSELRDSNFLYGDQAPDTFTVYENGVAYQVFLNDGLMTGIFLDQHDVRASLVDGLASGKKVLNMFSYTAAFSVAAAMGGASETVSVDLAKRSRDLSKAHFMANGLPLDHHQFVVMDVFEYFNYAKRKGLKFDMIILDPPSFARNKKHTFTVAKDYYKLIEQSLEILHSDGMIIASTNAANISIDKFKQQVQKGLGKVKYRFLQTYRLPNDFTVNKNDESSNYLKVFTIQVQK